MNAEERTVLNTVNTNLRVLGKGQTIAKEIVALPQTELEGGWETTLDRIAKKNDIQVRYKDVEEAPISGSHHRLLEVDFMPMVVFSGTGASKKAADSMATKCTLGYLKTQLHVAGPKNSTRQMGKGNERADIAQRETRKPPDNMWAQTSRSAKTQNSKPAATNATTKDWGRGRHGQRWSAQPTTDTKGNRRGYKDNHECNQNEGRIQTPRCITDGLLHLVLPDILV